MSDSDKKIREKINEMDAAAGSGFDKGAAWQKLQLRMEPKPAVRNNRKYYYGIAVTLVLMLVGIAILMPEKDEIIHDIATAPVPAKKVDTAATTLVKNDVKINENMPMAKMAKAVKTRVNNHKSAAMQEVAPQIPISPANETNKMEVVVATTKELPQKPKVVHISDVAEEVPQYMPRVRGGFVTTTQYKYKNTTSQQAPVQNIPGGLFK